MAIHRPIKDKKIQTMTEPLDEFRPGTYSPTIIHLMTDKGLNQTRLTIYEPEVYNDNKPNCPAQSFTLYGKSVEKLCKILDAWRVKLKLTEEKNEKHD